MLLVLCLVGLFGQIFGMKTTSEQMMANNASQILSVVTQQNDTRFLGTDRDGPYTLLIPVDSAFTKLGTDELNNIISTPGLLDEVLGVHVIPGELFSFDFLSGRVIVSDNGHFIRVFKSNNGNTYLNDAKVLKWDVEANGAVLIFIDTVLDAPEGTIYEVLRKPEFGLTMLADLVDSAGLNRTLHRTAGPYTVFAPSQDAFNRLSSTIIDTLKQSPSLLLHVVQYHVHQGTVHLKSLDRNGTLTTLYSGHKVGITVTDDIYLNKVAQLEEADIDCDNGVVHIIDHVLLPSTLGAIIG